ncbi:cytochrome P450 [Nocardia sp. NPDC047654]|uniref:cytochrome P450 n=1 Tax=Nocardia sp. NPDC047654 TaxID=3364314 RepID=UPI00372280C1
MVNLDAFDLDPLDSALAVLLSTERGRQDPYPSYAELLAKPGLHRSAMGSLVATRFLDCEVILKNRRFGHAPATTPADFTTAEQYEAFRQRYPRVAQRAPVMLELNPPEHSRLRGLVSNVFTRRVVENLRPRITAIVDELLRGITGKFDVVSDLAIPLPALVISELLGIPRDGHYYVIPHIRRIIQAFDTPLPRSQNLDEIYRATELVEEYFTSLIRSKRAKPEEDLISDLVGVQDSGGKLSEAELISMLLLLFVAGYESSTNLIANGFHALLTHPSSVELLHRDPGSIPLAVEEMLRWDAPVQLVGRSALEDAEVSGQVVRKGEQVLLFLGAANRDPTHFSDPDRFSITRDEGAPLSFSTGIHYCLGAPLARLEAQILFAELLPLWSRLEPVSAAPVRFRTNLVLRGVASLEMHLRTGGR